MNGPDKSLVGPKRFQWNAGGWFGASLGSSAWMIVTACFLAFHHQPKLALVPVAGFAVVVTTAVVLWTRRDRIYPFSALMALLGLIAIVIPVVWALVASNASPEALAAMNWPDSIWTTVGVTAITPVLMLWFLIVERSTITTHHSASSNETDGA